MADPVSFFLFSCSFLVVVESSSLKKIFCIYFPTIFSFFSQVQLKLCPCKIKTFSFHTVSREVIQFDLKRFFTTIQT